MGSEHGSVQVEILGGIGEIGYSMVLISTPRARVLLDMGMRGLEEGLLRAPAAPRPEYELVDLLRTGQLRELPGIYDPAQLAADPDLAGAEWAQPDPRPTAVVLSHAHIDHEGALGFAHPEIPVYASTDTVRVLEAMRRCGEPRLGRDPEVRPVEPGTVVTVEDLSVELIPVDHDVPGASGVLVSTPEGTLAYSGDINFHRNEGRLSEEFTRRIRGTDMLVTETTMLSWGLDERPDPRTEDEVDAAIVEGLERCDGLALLSVYHRDAERAARMIRLAEEHGRTLIWPTQHAVFLDAMGVEGLVSWAGDRPEADRKRLPSTVGQVSLEDVRESPSSYLVQPDAADMPALADLPLTPGGSLWIHAQGEPLGPFMFGWELFHQWLDHLGVEAVEAGSSGHAPGRALIEFVESAQPGVVVPIHGFRPEALEVEVPRLLPEYGVRYGLDGRVIGGE